MTERYGYLLRTRMFKSSEFPDDWVQIDAGVKYQIVTEDFDYYVLWKSGVSIRVKRCEVQLL